MPPPRVPADNPMSEEKFQLGRHLFYDKRLSGNGTLSCGSCHLQVRAFTDGRMTGVGSTGEHTPRNPPSIVNSAWHATYTWANPALVTLERQTENPMFGERPIEMGVNDANRAEIVARFRADADYRRWFKEAFPEKADPISFETIIKAISAFERGVISFNSRYDQYLQGKIKLTEAEQRGHDLFSAKRPNAIIAMAASISTTSSSTRRRGRWKRHSTTPASIISTAREAIPIPTAACSI